MATEYDEQAELMSYVRRYYGHLFAGRDFMPPEELEAKIPQHLRKEYLAHLAECDGITRRVAELAWIRIRGQTINILAT